MLLNAEARSVGCPTGRWAGFFRAAQRVCPYRNARVFSCGELLSARAEQPLLTGQACP